MSAMGGKLLSTAVASGNGGLPHLRSRNELISFYRQQRRRSKDGYGRWLALIKELRVKHSATLIEAERIALSNPHLRRWIEKQINTRQQCRKHALTHIRYNGDSSLIQREGESFNFKIPQIARHSSR